MTLTPRRYCAISGQLAFQTALHVGTGRGHAGADSPVRRNGHGDLILPGTAIAGALRALATRLAPRMALSTGERAACMALTGETPEENVTCGCAVCHLFGELYPNENDNEETGGRASRLSVFDAPLFAAPAPFVRDGVGIDRETGAAARAGRLKFDTEIIPAGAVFDVRLELEEADDDDERLLAAVLAEWEAGRAWLGGDSSRGLGRATLDGLKCVRNDLATADDLLLFLREDDPDRRGHEDIEWMTRRKKEARAASQAAHPVWPFIEAEFVLAFGGPFITHDATVAGILGFDHVSLIDGVPGLGSALRPVLPGSGLRGALRSHAERIARTVASAKVKDKQRFLQMCPACNPVEDRADRALTKCDKLFDPDEDVAAERLCLACRLFGSPRHGSRLKVMDAPLVGEPVWKAIDFLAIDRFTGGGLDTAKFDAAALWRPRFAAQLYLEEPQEWELGWLALTLRDLAEGRLSIGFGAAKGFGQARAEAIRVRCGFVDDTDWPDLTTNCEVKEAPGFYRVAELTQAQWRDAQPIVKDWAKQFYDEIVSPKARFDSAAREKDTYFGQAAQRLYPIAEASHA